MTKYPNPSNGLNLALDVAGRMVLIGLMASVAFITAFAFIS